MSGEDRYQYERGFWGVAGLCAPVALIFIVLVAVALPRTTESDGDTLPDAGLTGVLDLDVDTRLGDAGSSPLVPRPGFLKDLREASAAFAALKTLEGLLMYTEGLDMPTVTISGVRLRVPGDARVAINPMVRVAVRLPGKRPVSRSGWSLRLVLSDALAASYDVGESSKKKR